MNFLSPLSLLLFIPLGGIVVLLYLLKLKRVEHVVSSVFLWRDAVADIQANAPFQKLKKSLLLLLQLLALLFLAVAIARPYIRAQGISDNKIVVIIDSSASMQSTDISPSRFENAKSRAKSVVGEMGPGDSMLVVTAGAKARVVSSFSSDKRALTTAISALKPADTGCNMRQAMVLALSLVQGKSKQPPRVVVLSDGGFGALSDLSAANAKLDFVKIGRRCDNVAITGLDSRKTLSGDQQVFIGLRNFADRERRFNLEIYLNDQLLDIREETLKPGETKQEILPDTANLGGRITAKLDVPDDLAADNSGSVYLTRRRKIEVLLVSKGNIFLQNALNLDPRTQLTRSDSVPSGFARSGYDLVVFDSITPPKSLPSGGYLLVNTSAAQGPADQGAAVAGPTIIDSDKHHPASAYVDFAGMRVANAHYLKPKPWASAIVEGEGGAVAAAGSDQGRRFVQLGFSLMESDFPLRVGFPIFVANCLDWLSPATESGAGDSVRTGQAMYIDVGPETKSLTVIRPDGSKQSLPVTQTPVIFDDTDRAGVYRVEGKGVKREFACNLSSPAESGTAPKDALTVGARKFASSTKAIRTNREFYSIAVMIVLGVLTFEWYAYHRRI